MRIDALTIFPDYIEPLRHALLGKAIEDGRLTVAVHDLRRWATGVHKAVDDKPMGGGPGMVMMPEVWGPALDDVLSLSGPATEATALDSAEVHRSSARHDELTGSQERPYGEAQTDDRPLLLVPTPAGKPFTQADAREWSREERIVFACGRYEGIDQRVFDDAAQRYRVREVSIGDYVLIGGEVAVLVIAEAVVRLIPGVLGNQASHQEDSFSDGLLEGPCYTKPRTWRGLDVPDVLTSGDHGKIERWRRDQSLLHTKAVRPELLAQADLDKKDLFTVNARDVYTELSVLMTPERFNEIAGSWPKKLKKTGYEVSQIDAELQDLTCEPDNMLVTQYGQIEGRPPLDPVLRVLINGRSDRDLRELTQLVVNLLPKDTYWYGTTTEGHQEPGIKAFCAWQG